MLIELDKIKIDAGTQSRVEINEEVVKDYHEALENGTELPPIKVFSDGLYHYVADGFHRYHAHRRSEREFIDCDVQVGTVRDAVRFSLSANHDHGLRRTIADKRKAVQTVLDDPEWSELSSRKIAEICAVSHPFVLSIIRPQKAVTLPPKEKPAKLKNVVEEPLDEPVTLPPDDAVAELIAENERLQDRLAVEVMDGSDEEKLMAQETIGALRSEVKSLQAELDAVKKSRDQYQMECSELKKQIKILQRQLKK